MIYLSGVPNLSTKFISTDDIAYGYKQADGKPRFINDPYYKEIAEGNISNHTAWTKIGYTPSLVASTESDVWSAGGTITFASTPQQMMVVSSNNVDDIGTVIFSGTSSGGSTTTLVDASKNFLGGTAVAAGDWVLLTGVDEYGIVTSVTATTLTLSGGFSKGGSGSGKAYSVIDKSATLGAQATRIEYLDTNYDTQHCFVILNGTTPVNTVPTDLYRINSFRVIAAGDNGYSTGNLSLKNTANTITYSYITAKYTRARNIAYTVPNGKNLYVVSVMVAYGYSTNQTHYCRIYTRATQNDNFHTGNIMYTFSEVICANTSQQLILDIPSKIISKVDMKTSAIATYAGAAMVGLRGWLEDI